MPRTFRRVSSQESSPESVPGRDVLKGFMSASRSLTSSSSSLTSRTCNFHIICRIIYASHVIENVRQNMSSEHDKQSKLASLVPLIESY